MAATKGSAPLYLISLFHIQMLTVMSPVPDRCATDSTELDVSPATSWRTACNKASFIFTKGGGSEVSTASFFAILVVQDSMFPSAFLLAVHFAPHQFNPPGTTQSPVFGAGFGVLGIDVGSSFPTDGAEDICTLYL